MTESSMFVYVFDVSCFPPFGVTETTLKPPNVSLPNVPYIYPVCAQFIPWVPCWGCCVNLKLIELIGIDLIFISPYLSENYILTTGVAT